MEVRSEEVGSADSLRLLREYCLELRELLTLPFDLDAQLEASRRELSREGGAFLVGRVRGRPVACGGLRRLEPGVAEAKRMFVRPAHRGHGFGRTMLEALEDRARRDGCTMVRLDTAAPLQVAKRLYCSAGYRPIPDYNGNPHAAYWFEKRL